MMTHVIRVKCLRCSGAHASLGITPGEVFWGELDAEREYLRVKLHGDLEIVLPHRRDAVYGDRHLRFRDEAYPMDDADHDREQLAFALFSLKRMAIRMFNRLVKK